MPGIPLDAMDKLKAFFNKHRKGTAGTKTTTNGTPAAVPQPAPTDKPTTSDPTTAPAGAAPVDAPAADKPADPVPSATPVA